MILKDAIMASFLIDSYPAAIKLCSFFLLLGYMTHLLGQICIRLIDLWSDDKKWYVDSCYLQKNKAEDWQRGEDEKIP